MISSAALSFLMEEISSLWTLGSISSRVSEACSVSSSLKMASRCSFVSSYRMSAMSTGCISGSFSLRTFSLTLPLNLPMSSGSGCT